MSAECRHASRMHLRCPYGLPGVSRRRCFVEISAGQISSDIFDDIRLILFLLDILRPAPRISITPNFSPPPGTNIISTWLLPIARRRALSRHASPFQSFCRHYREWIQTPPLIFQVIYATRPRRVDRSIAPYITQKCLRFPTCLLPPDACR